jgi:uncharacterized integral membrane protein
MDWRRLELWVTISFGLAAGTGVFLLLFKIFAPQDGPLQQWAQGTITFLSELGDISGGLIVIIFIAILGGNIFMTVLLRGIEKLHEMREERKRIREESRAAGLAEGRIERDKEWEAWAERLIEQGLLPPDVSLPSVDNTPDKHQG